MILEHVHRRDLPAEWTKSLKDILSSTYRITIEAESRPEEKSMEQSSKSWRNVPMFGMWKDRDNMADPAEYVRQLRKPRF